MVRLRDAGKALSTGANIRRFKRPFATASLSLSFLM